MVNTDEVLNVVKKGIDLLAKKKGKLKVTEVETDPEEIKYGKNNVKSIGDKYDLTGSK